MDAYDKAAEALNQATSETLAILDRGIAQAEANARSMSDITVVCPLCGGHSTMMVKSADHPTLHTVYQRCSRCW